MHYNYLLFVPSLVTKDTEIQYTIKVDNASEMEKAQYTGIQTNEALTKFLTDYLANEGETLNKIIMLCTREVQNEQLPQIENRTTLEYYKQSITQFVQEQKTIDLEKLEQLFEVVDYVPESNENENKIIEALEQIIAPEENMGCVKRVFVDFTGGMRNSALTLVFATRILDKAGVEVSKILYSNFQTKTIEECTRTYRIFAEFEEGIKLQNNIIDSESEYEGKSEAEIQAKNKFKEMVDASRMNQSKNVKETEKALDTALGDIDRTNMSHTQKQNLKTLEKGKEKIIEEIHDPILAIKNHLKKSEYVEALTDFREKITEVLLNAQIIKVSERCLENGKIKGDFIANEIAAAYGYYIDSKDKKTFLNTVKTYVRLLNENPDKSPKEIKEQYFGESYFDLETYLSEAPKGGFTHNSFSKWKSDNVTIPCVENYYNKTKNMKEALKRYVQFDNLYMGYGFPFACTYGRKFYFDGYDKKYRNNFENGVNCLQEFYEKKQNKKIKRIMNAYPEEKFDYQALVQAMDDGEHKEILHIVFPFMLCSGNISCDAMDYLSWSEFMFEFSRAYCVIKEVRNKTIHPHEMEDAQIQEAFRQLNDIIEKIETLREEIPRKDMVKDERR